MGAPCLLRPLGGPSGHCRERVVWGVGCCRSLPRQVLWAQLWGGGLVRVLAQSEAGAAEAVSALRSHRLRAATRCSRHRHEVQLSQPWGLGWARGVRVPHVPASAPATASPSLGGLVFRQHADRQGAVQIQAGDQHCPPARPLHLPGVGVAQEPGSHRPTDHTCRPATSSAHSARFCYLPTRPTLLPAEGAPP